MGFFTNLFKKQPTATPIPAQCDYAVFWNWFKQNAQSFYQIAKTQNSDEIEQKIFTPLATELAKIKDGILKDGILFLIGMPDDNSVELFFSPEGKIKDIVFIEELVNAAPEILNWQFRALKPAINDADGFSIKMQDYAFSSKKLFFYPIKNQDYPDLVDLVIVHSDYEAEVATEIKQQIEQGVYMFIDNLLGEYRAITAIDYLTIIPKNQAEKELIPIAKLNDYLIQREQEFTEKYHQTSYSTEDDKFNGFEATIDGLPLIGIIDSTVLNWKDKASHPWILHIQIKFTGNAAGLPDENTSELLYKIEDEIMPELRDIDGYLNIGRQTNNHIRTIYFACKDFRKPAKLIYELINKYKDQLDITYDIYKDKYWTTFNSYRAD